MAEARAARIAGTVAACLIADGADFRSRRVEALTLDFAGIVGDIHAGLTRASTSREPWYERGTEVRNDRQVSIVSVEELAEVAAAMALPEIAGEWIGANLVTAGIADLTGLPPGTRLTFAGGAVLMVEAENGPCRTAGGSIAGHFPARDGLDLLFLKEARHKRGLVASVERPGMVAAGEGFAVRLPPRRPWPAA
jgi:hypothetical protein